MDKKVRCLYVDTSHHARGFTLLELLVAIAIFAVLAAMAYGGLNTVLNTSRYATIQVERLTKIQLAVATISRDFIQIVDRPYRDEYGDTQPSFSVTGVPGNNRIEFTRGGIRNPGGLPRASLQHIGYIVQDNQLLRISWQVLDRAQDNTPLSVAILDRVNGLILRFLDTNETWHDQWPLADHNLPTPTNNLPMTANSTLPRAMEINLDLQDLGRITRIYPIKG